MRYYITASLVYLPFLTPSVTHAATVVGDSGISTTGTIAAASISLTTDATTWGYISSTGSYLPNLATNQISTTRITNLNTPTATSDAATKSYVDTVAAAAGTTPLMCATTYTTYTGNLGGVSGANTKCTTDFGTGWTFAQPYKVAYYQSSLAGAAPYNTTSFRPIGSQLAITNSATSKAWMNSAGSTSTYSCSSWTSASTTSYGSAIIDTYSNYSTFDNNSSCGNALPLVCCNY